MKKFMPIIIVGILVLSGLEAAAFSPNVSIKSAMIIKHESASVVFSSQPTPLEKDDYVEIKISNATTHLTEANKPVLPIYVKTYEIPFGCTNIQVTCTPTKIDTMSLTKEIIPAHITTLSNTNAITAYVKDSSVYESAALYPGSWYSYDLGAGRNENNQQVTFVKVVCYPVQYSPLNNQIQYTSGFEININYDAPVIQQTGITSTYDMVIIAPAAFQSALQPLIDFKNSKGMKTTFKSVEDILSEFTGYDQPEQVKYFIKYAYDTWGITYALLVGGLKSHIYAKDKDTISAGWKAWWIPVRYVSMPQGDDEGCLSDLYYGCLYNATGAFDSWDSNGDHVYAAWDDFPYKKDIIDMYPEVYVGRLACADVNEVKTVVNKILNYESTGPAAKPWYTNFIGIGGKTFAYYQGKPDGEYLCDLSYNYTKNTISNLNLIKVYSTNRNTSGLVPDRKGITSAITQGAGFVDFEGHGNPYSWNCIWFDGQYPKDWVGGLNIFYFPLISNGDKLPVVNVGGCHNAMYNISMIPALLDKVGTTYFVHGMPIPFCFCWGLLVKPRGGAIGSMGCTGYGFGDEDNPNTLSGALDVNFFYQVGNGSTHLAQAHSLAITKYLNEHPIDQIDAFCITEWALFGDPSLRFGGY